MTARISEVASRQAAISGLTMEIITIAPTTASTGGSTFQAVVFSAV